MCPFLRAVSSRWSRGWQVEGVYRFTFKGTPDHVQKGVTPDHLSKGSHRFTFNRGSRIIFKRIHRFMSKMNHVRRVGGWQIQTPASYFVLLFFYLFPTSFLFSRFNTILPLFPFLLFFLFFFFFFFSSLPLFSSSFFSFFFYFFLFLTSFYFLIFNIFFLFLSMSEK